MHMFKGLLIVACLAAVALQSSAKPQQGKRGQQYQLFRRQQEESNELPGEGRVNPTKLAAVLNAALGHGSNGSQPTATTTITTSPTTWLGSSTTSTSPTAPTGTTPTTTSPTVPAKRAYGDDLDLANDDDQNDDEEEEEHQMNYHLAINMDDEDDEDSNDVAGYPAYIATRKGQRSQDQDALFRQRRQFRRRQQMQRRRQQANKQRRRQKRRQQQQRRRQRQQQQRRRRNRRRNMQQIKRFRQGGRNRSGNRRIIRIRG